MHKKPSIKASLQAAIEKAGGRSALARTLALSGPAVIYQWQQTRVPAEQCPAIERETGIQCELLRPDVDWAFLRNTTVKQDA